MNTGNNRCRRGRGFATIIAVALIALIGVALAAMAAMARADFARTRQVQADTQIRQLLLAGESAARERLAAGDAGGKAVTVDLPAVLKDDGTTLTLTLTRLAPPAGGGGVAARIEVRAEAGGYRRSQTVRYARRDAGAGWSLVAAELGPLQRSRP